MALEQSILKSVKKMLNLADDYTYYDTDIIIHINSALSVLTQVGVGPEGGMTIVDNAGLWTTFLGSDAEINSAKTFVYLKTRLAFDPPATSFAIEAMEKQILEYTWRLNVAREHHIWVDPTPAPTGSLDSVLDGGSP